MTDYSKMSDVEVAIRIARLFPERFLFNEDDEPYELIPDAAAAYTGSDFDEVIFDPCNSWADAGPIAEQNAICLNVKSPGETYGWIANSWLNRRGDIRFRDKKPLRAICIVFLMMNEGE